MGVILAKASSKLLKKFLNKEIPDDDYIFRRVPLSIFLECRPDHKFVICPQFFRNENGDGMSVDWERLCKDPKVTQTRNGKQPDTHGIIFLSVFDVKKFREQLLKIINDQINPIK